MAYFMACSLLILGWQVNYNLEGVTAASWCVVSGICWQKSSTVLLPAPHEAYLGIAYATQCSTVLQ
jgi:hypothetical protein